MTIETLQERCPAAFADAPASTVSSEYLFIPTRYVVDHMSLRGFDITACFNKKNDPTGAHMIRFRQNSAKPVVGDVFPELVWSSSHNATRAARLYAGLFRLVCANGATVALPGLSQRWERQHIGNQEIDIESEVTRIVDSFDGLTDTVVRMHEKTLRPAQALEFARRAWTVKTGHPVLGAQRDPAVLLERRRSADHPSNVWTIFNVVSEHLIRGGRARMTGVGEPRERLRLETELFALAEEALVWD